jgi:hypothetical protein
MASEVVGPESDVMKIGVFISHPHRSRSFFDKFDVGRVHRVADGAGQDDVIPVAVAVGNFIEMHDRTPGHSQ